MIGHRGSLILDYKRDYKLKHSEDAKELDLTRIYSICLPIYAPYEEVYEVLAEIKSDIEKMEADSKAAEEKKREELKQATEKVEQDLADIEEKAANL